MKWYYKVLIAVVVLLAIAFFSVDQIATSIAQKNIKIIQKELAGKYDFEYDDLNVSIIDKSIVLKKFSLVTVVDSTNFNENKFDFTLNRLVLHFDKYMDVISDSKLHIQFIELKGPEITYGVRRKMNKEDVNETSFVAQSDTESNSSSDSTQNLLVNSLLIDSLVIFNGVTEVFHLDDPQKKIIHIEKLNLFSKDLEVNFAATTLDDIVSSTEMIVNLNKISSDALVDHDLAVTNLNFTINKNILLISDVHFKNMEKPKEFASKQKYRSPWLDVKVDTIRVEINPWHVYNKGVLYIKNIDIIGVEAELYNDVTLALKPIHQPMPPRAIRDISIPIKIDNINVKRGHLRYLHKTKAERPGVFELNDISIKGGNVTNIEYLIDQDSSLFLNVDGILWDTGKLKVDITLDLKSELDYVYIKGSILNMPLEKAENMVKPMFGVNIPSGYMNNLSYNLTMNENIGRGSIRFDYKDLKVDIKKDSTAKHTEESGQVKSNKFLNFVGNEAIISNNIPGTKNYKESGYMIYDRSKDKPIFDLFWHSLQTGIMDIVVIDAFYKSKVNYEKKEKKKVKEATSKKKKESKRKKNRKK